MRPPTPSTHKIGGITRAWPGCYRALPGQGKRLASGFATDNPIAPPVKNADRGLPHHLYGLDQRLDVSQGEGECLQPARVVLVPRHVIGHEHPRVADLLVGHHRLDEGDRKSTRLNSSHL